MAKILIVDDIPANRSLLVDMLRNLGHTIREASDGGEALALVSAEGPDLVITDILMPTMDGYEFVRRLRAITEVAHTPVIFWTAVFRESDARDLARECGVEYTVCKPCGDETMLQTVEAALHHTAAPTPVAENFDRDHLRLVMDKLSKQAVEMNAVNARLDALLEASLRLASETEPSRLADEFCKSARHLVSSKFALVGIAEENADQVYVAGLPLDAYPGLRDARRVHAVMAGLISGQQPVRARNTSADPGKFGFPPAFPNFGSLLVAPIASPTRRYGWLGLFHRLGAVEFTEEDARLSGILGGLAGRIYENRKLYATAQSQKAEALSQLAGGMAHDFNNALNVIIGYSQLILSKLGSTDALYNRVAEIQKAGERAAGLTKHLLAFSGKQMLHPRSVDSADLLRDLEPGIRETLGQSVELVTRFDQQLSPVKIDAEQLKDAIVNIVANAREAMPDGGKLTIELKNTELDDSSARAFGVAAGRYVTLTVTDTGRGMTAQVKQRAFEPFFSTKPAGQGVGLGLASAFGVVRQSGGHIYLESQQGVGTACKVFLPQDGDTQKAESSKSRNQASQRRTILLVDDDPAIRLLVEEILVSAGYNVIVAGTGSKAVQLADEYDGDIHLLLTDVVLSGMGGKEIASRVKLVRPEIEILFMSGYTGNVADERENLGTDVEFLQKPFSPDALCDRIGSIISAPSAATASLSPSESAKTIRRILVVDDDPSLRNLLAQTLDGAGFQAFTAEDGHEARMQIKGNQIDLVITDLAMPREEGMELIRALKKEQPQIKIVAMSGAFGTDVLRAAGALGAHVSLVKPVSRETVLQCIEQLSKK